MSYWHPDRRFRINMGRLISGVHGGDTPFGLPSSTRLFDAQMTALEVVPMNREYRQCVGWCFVPNPELVALRLGDK